MDMDIPHAGRGCGVGGPANGSSIATPITHRALIALAVMFPITSWQCGVSTTTWN
jgi:hypothetical protein